MATLVEANPQNTAVAAVVHPLIVRLTHWVNAGAMIVMIISGWQIHNAYPTLPFSFPGMLTLGDGLAGGLRWHFAAMWVLVINGAIYLGPRSYIRAVPAQAVTRPSSARHSRCSASVHWKARTRRPRRLQRRTASALCWGHWCRDPYCHQRSGDLEAGSVWFSDNAVRRF